MKKLLIATIICLTMPIFSFSQTYSALWKQVTDAQNKDLPQTEQEALGQIVKKAEKAMRGGSRLAETRCGAAERTRCAG